MRILALLAFCGCATGPSNAVNLTIVSDSSLTADLRAKVSEIDIDVTGVQTKSKMYPLSGLPAEERVQLLPKVTSGTITIAVSVKDTRTNVLGKGSVDVDLNGKTVAKTITLTYTPATKINVTPATATVTRGKTLQLMTDQTVTWSASAGTIDINGLYTAPDAPGAATITATSPTDDTNSATAMITVADYGLELLAGKGGGWGEADGVGGAARFFFPMGIVSDNKGTLYIGDNFGCDLRKFNLATSEVTTIGGLPEVCGDVIDGQLGADARFSTIRDLAYDATANALWVIDGSFLRSVDLGSGAVTTVFGPAGLSGLAIDEANQILYFARAGSHVIEELGIGPSPSPSPAVIIAGTNRAPGSADGVGLAASFNTPLAVALAGGHLYIADSKNHTIRDLELSTMNVTTLAGAPGVAGEVDGVGSAARFDTPQSLALSSAGNALYVGDDKGVVHTLSLVNKAVTRVAGQIPPSPSPGAPQTFAAGSDGAPGTNARLGSVHLATDSGNVIYLADRENSVIRSMAGGNFGITTLAGNIPSFGYSDGPGAMSRFWQPASLTSKDDIVYVAENANAVVRKIDLRNGVVTTIAGSPGLYGGDDGIGGAARFRTPEGIFIEANFLYVSDGTGATIRRIDLATNLVTTIAGHDSTMGSLDDVGIDARFGYPQYLTGDHQDHLFITDGLSPTVRRMTLSTGKVETIAGDPNVAEHLDGTGTAAHFVYPYGMAIENNVLYVCDTNQLRAVTLDTFSVSTPPLKDAQNAAVVVHGLQGCAGDGKGHVYMGDTGVLRRFDVASQSLSVVVGKPFVQKEAPGPLSSATIGYVSGIAFAKSGDLVFADNYDGAIYLVRMP